VNILLTAILLTNFAILVIILAVILKIRALSVRISSVYHDLISFITPDEAGKPSAMAVVASTYADMLSRSFVSQIKATFMGQASGKSRGEAAVDVGLAEAQSPLLGMAISAIPSLGKTLKRNPALLDYAMNTLSHLGNAGKSQTGSSGSRNGASNQIKFKF